MTLPDYDIICLTETWLNSSIDTSELGLLKNFHVFRSDRSKNSSLKSGGGGVLLAVNRNFKCTSIVVNEHIDQVTVKIWTGDIALVMCAVYIPPLSTIDKYYSFIDMITNNISEHENFCIIGDLNLAGYKWLRLNQVDKNSIFSKFYIPLNLKKKI